MKLNFPQNPRMLAYCQEGFLCHDPTLFLVSMNSGICLTFHFGGGVFPKHLAITLPFSIILMYTSNNPNTKVNTGIQRKQCKETLGMADLLKQSGLFFS